MPTWPRTRLRESLMVAGIQTTPISRTEGGRTRGNYRSGRAAVSLLFVSFTAKTVVGMRGRRGGARQKTTYTKHHVSNPSKAPLARGFPFLAAWLPVPPRLGVLGSVLLPIRRQDRASERSCAMTAGKGQDLLPILLRRPVKRAAYVPLSSLCGGVARERRFVSRSLQARCENEGVGPV